MLHLQYLEACLRFLWATFKCFKYQLFILHLEMKALHSFILISFVAALVLITSCKKGPDDVAPVVPQDSIVVLPPTTFSKKILVENFLSTTCGYCAWGIDDLKKIDSLYGNRVISVTFHGNGNDPMYTPSYDILGNYFLNTIIPAGCVNRIGTSFNEPLINFPNSFINHELDSSASCGLAINATNVHDSIAQIEVKAAFNQALTGDIRLVVYLVEDSVTGGPLYSQQNWNCSTCSAPDPGSSFYNLPALIYPFYHKDVFRKQLTPNQVWGDTIPVSYRHFQGELRKSYTVNTGSLTGKFYIVAFITLNGDDYLSHHVLNSQKVRLGFNKNYD
jgi:hypothetical protein